MSKHSPVQVVDENDSPIGSASLKEVHQKSLRHRIVMIIVLNPNNEILLQMRSSNVWTHPNKWDVSAAGHVDEGEDYLAAAKRELYEETGLKGLELEEIGYFKTTDSYKNIKLKRFKTIYKVMIPRDTKFILNPEEVEYVKWFSKEDIKDLIEFRPDEIIYDFTKILNKFYL